MEVIENRWWTPFKLPSNIELPSNTNGLLENPPFLDGWTPCLSATIHPQLGDDRWNRWISDQYVYIQLYPIYFTSHSLSRDISHCTHLDIYLFYLLFIYIYIDISPMKIDISPFLSRKRWHLFSQDLSTRWPCNSWTSSASWRSNVSGFNRAPSHRRRGAADGDRWRPSHEG